MSLALIKRYEEEAKTAYSEALSLQKEVEKSTDLPAVKVDEIDKLLDDAQAWMDRANKVQQQERNLKAMNDPAGGGIDRYANGESKTLDSGGKALTSKEKANAEYDVISWKYQMKGDKEMSPAEMKVLSSRSDPDGGYLITEDFRNKLIKRVRDLVHIRRMATVITTQAATISFPSFEFDGTQQDLLENQQFTVQDLQDMLGKENFTPHKHGTIFKIPEELLEDDTTTDIEEMMLDHFATRFAELEEIDLLLGNGITQPLGLLNSGLPETDMLTSASNALTAEDIIGIPYEIRAVYRNSNRCVYMMHRNFIKQVRLLREGDLQPSNDAAVFTVGGFLWQPSFKAGEPPTLNGFPTLESEWMPDGTSNTTGDPYIFFGDLKHYWIIDRKGFGVKRLEEKYAEFDQIGLRLRKRYDGAPVLRDPFQIIVRQA